MYIDAVEDLRKVYLRFSGEMILAMKGRMESVQEVDVVSVQP